MSGTMILNAGAENVVNLQAYRERRRRNSDERWRVGEGSLHPMVPIVVVPMTVLVPFGWTFNWAIVGFRISD